MQIGQQVGRTAVACLSRHLQRTFSHATHFITVVYDCTPALATLPPPAHGLSRPNKRLKLELHAQRLHTCRMLSGS